MRRVLSSFRASGSVVACLLVIAAAGACAGGPAPNVDPGVAGARDDSVSLGYGRVARGQSTGAVGRVDADDLANAPVGRVEEMLQGRVPGLQVTRLASGDYSLRIRGVTTLRGSGEPLLVIDGMPVESYGFGSVLNGISPQDIARIEVLKDAGSTAIYGSRGANGVILISLKRH